MASISICNADAHLSVASVDAVTVVKRIAMALAYLLGNSQKTMMNYCAHGDQQMHGLKSFSELLERQCQLAPRCHVCPTLPSSARVLLLFPPWRLVSATLGNSL